MQLPQTKSFQGKCYLNQKCLICIISLIDQGVCFFYKLILFSSAYVQEDFIVHESEGQTVQSPAEHSLGKRDA